MNLLISNINLCALEEINSVFACILFKGHGKDPTSDRSLRTISTYPVLAKALDTYIGELYGSGWADQQAETQFQGEGSCHSLAALLLTEAIQHSTFTLKQPLYCLFLDAKSAYDKILTESVIKQAYLAGTQDHGLLYLNHRLKNRKTFIEYNKVLMGPISDKLGLEQGGKNSDKYYRLVNNCQLSEAQLSGLGVDLSNNSRLSGVDLGDNINVACIGQADDVALISSSIHSLRNLVKLTTDYCDRFKATLLPEKMKLLAFGDQKSLRIYYDKLTSNININSEDIQFVDEAEHVGVLRSVAGSLPSLLARFSAHRKAVMAVLPVGLARGHRGNPATVLRVEKIYGAPVLLSGLSSLVLNKSEIAALDHHYKKTLESLQKLYPATPNTVVHFLGGSLPATALLHLAQFSILSMISRLEGNILLRHAINILSSPSPKSWFSQVNKLCTQYSLPSALTLLSNPLPKLSFKKTVKSAVIDFWEQKFRLDTISLSSLKYFKPEFYSLCTPHPLWTSAGTNPYEVEKSVTQARMLSGRYRCEKLRRHWSQNSDGHCELTPCSAQGLVGSIEHMLVDCAALSASRAGVLNLWQRNLEASPHLFPVVNQYMGSEFAVQFILDPSTLPGVITARHYYGGEAIETLFNLTRTYCHTLHKTKMKLLGLILVIYK